MSGYKLDGIDIDTVCDFDTGTNTTTINTLSGYKKDSVALVRKYYKHFHANVAAFPELQVSISKYKNGSAAIIPSTSLVSPEYISYEYAWSGSSVSIPSGITGMYIYITGGGGGGGGGGLRGGDHTSGDGGGGGGGGACLSRYIAVVAGKTTYNYTVGAGGTGGNNGYSENGGNINSSHDGVVGSNGGDSSFTYNSVTYTAPGGKGGGPGSYLGSTATYGGAGGLLPTATGTLVTSRDSAEAGAVGSANSNNDGGTGGAGSYPNIQKDDWGVGHYFNTYRWMGIVNTNNMYDPIWSLGLPSWPGYGGAGGDGDNNATSKYPLDGKTGGTGMVKIWWLYGPK